MNRHLKSIYECEECGEKFHGEKGKRSYIRHLKSHQPKPPKPQKIQSLNPPGRPRVQKSDDSFMCRVCGKVFKFASYLNRHMVVHTNKKRKLDFQLEKKSPALVTPVIKDVQPVDLIENSAPDLIENFGHDSLVIANNATQQLTKQLVLNLKSNWPSLSNTVESQPNSSNSKNCETISLEPDLEKKSKIDENKLGCKKIIPASSFLNNKAHVLDLEELTVDPTSQKSLTENQSLVNDLLTCSKDNCGFKTKHKRCLDLHIKGNR